METLGNIGQPYATIIFLGKPCGPLSLTWPEHQRNASGCHQPCKRQDQKKHGHEVQYENVRDIDIMWTARWQFMHLCTATARHAAQNMLPSARRTTIRMSRPWLRHKIDCKYGNRNNRRVSKIDWLESSGIDLLKAVPKEADGMTCSLDSFDSFSFVFLAACDVQKIERPETQLGIVKSGGRADICTEARETHYRQQ